MVFQIFATVVALVLLFIFGINKFSKHIEIAAGGRFKSLIKRLASHPIIGTITGLFAASVFQSSTATVVMTIGLVNAGVISFYESLGIIFGANVGTTLTSQLIALNVTAIAPFIVVLGFILLKAGEKYDRYGKPVFYFGLVFLCISLISQVVAPLATEPEVIQVLSQITSMPVAILAGIILTVIFQASSITIGFSLVLAASGLIDLHTGVGLMLGANIGTTSTAIFAAMPMGKDAKKAALAHVFFSIAGLVIVLPFLDTFIQAITSLGGGTAQQIANMHVAFNVISAAIFLLFIKQFQWIIEWLSHRSFLHVEAPTFEPKL